MRKIEIALTCILCLSAVSRGAAQECASLEHGSPTRLFTYLTGILPNEGNAECITVAIQRLTPLRFEPAIPVLVKLLDFHRPPTEEAKIHIYQRPQVPEELYPAAGALEEFGKPALPAVLEVIKSSSSAKALENAVLVWMEIYKYETPKGVAVLQREAFASDDPAVKQNLRWALSKAPMWCTTDRAECEAAAVVP